MKQSDYIDTVKKAAIVVGKESVLKCILTELPFLANPLISPFIGMIVSKIVTVLIEQTEFAMLFAYIDTRTSHEGEVFSQAVFRNHQAQISGSYEEKIMAEKHLIDSFKQFAKFN